MDNLNSGKEIFIKLNKHNHTYLPKFDHFMIFKEPKVHKITDAPA